MNQKQLNTDSNQPERASPKRLVFSMSSNGTSGQVGPKQSKKPHRVFRQESAQEPPSERLHQGADSSGYQAHTERAAPTLRTEKTGAAHGQTAPEGRKQKRTGHIKSAAYAAGAWVKSVVHSQIGEAEQENVGVEAAHRVELAGERACKRNLAAVEKPPALLFLPQYPHTRKYGAGKRKYGAGERICAKATAETARTKKARQAAQAARTAQKTAVTTEKTANFVVRHPASYPDPRATAPYNRAAFIRHGWRGDSGERPIRRGNCLILSRGRHGNRQS